MASEVQRIIALSLNKIVASRTRRGGVSLHRNLLVASVIIRAKDAYIAETVAKRKKDMDAEAVVPNLECTETSEEEELAGDSRKGESESEGSGNSSFTGEDQDRQFDEQEVEGHIEDEEFHSCDSKLKPIEVDVANSEPYGDIMKENQDPNVSSSVCVGRCKNRKRCIQELDSSVLEYSDDSDSSNLFHSDISENGPSCKYLKLNSPCNIESSQNSLDLSDSHDLSNCNKISNSDSGDICWEYSRDRDYDNCSKSSVEPTNQLLTSYSCPSEQQTFAQVTLTHTNLLIATV